MEYIPGSANQYTERQMRARVRKLRWKLLWHRGFDILVTHAPAFGLNDMEDLPHRGFKAFLTLMDKYHPKFFSTAMSMPITEENLNGRIHMEVRPW